jgi:inositol-hexakisphosphate 5-kinase
MLVTYRRKPKCPSPLESTAFQHLPSETADHHSESQLESVTASFSQPLSRVIEDQVDEGEMPIVDINRNRHIVPKWMLRGRNRAYSQPYTSKFGRVELGSRDLGTNDASSSTLRRPGTTQLSFQPSTGLATSPCLSTRSVIYKNGKSQSEEELPVIDTPKPGSAPPRKYSFATGGFGGTGSTVVNAKFKDHVFSAILRRYRPRVGGRFAANAKTSNSDAIREAECDSDLADSETGTNATPSLAFSHIEDLSHVEGLSTPTNRTLRRVHSESTMASHEKLDALTRETQHCESAAIDMVADHKQPERGHATPRSWQRVRQRRSRSSSSSLGSPASPSRIVPTSSVKNDENDSSVTRQNHFILMEDLTGRLKRSCVLDLKMGTRQYGMDATASKKRSHRKKCDRSTSRSLGARICGMQVKFSNLNYASRAQ